MSTPPSPSSARLVVVVVVLLVLVHVVVPPPTLDPVAPPPVASILVNLAPLVASQCSPLPRGTAVHPPRLHLRLLPVLLANDLREARRSVVVAIIVPLALRSASEGRVIPRSPATVPLPDHGYPRLDAIAPRKAAHPVVVLIVGFRRAWLVAGRHRVVKVDPAPQCRRVRPGLDGDTHIHARSRPLPALLPRTAILVGLALGLACLEHVVPRRAAPSSAEPR